MRQNYAANVSALDDERLEAFVADWLAVRTHEYVESERWSGPGDMGRDVVGYTTTQRHEGPWDNFQCKQLQARLSERDAFLELGKIFMHAANGAYILPRMYTFVAPRGVVRNVKMYVAHPERFRAAFISKWDEYCAPDLVENSSVALSPEIRKMIGSFGFEKVYALDAEKLVVDKYIKPALVKWFGDDPGDAPRGIVPDELLSEEALYVRQLVDAYAERSGALFANAAEVLTDSRWGGHLRDQRTRYFDAAEFRRYYRDSTPPEYLETFQDDIYHGVIDVHSEDHKDSLARATAVLGQAATVQPSGVLGRYARVPVKQGVCHHFANEGKLLWKR